MKKPTRTAPWQYHKDLSEERLDALCTLLAYIHTLTLSEHEKEHGDTEWGLGCRCFDRCRSAILKLEGKVPWLRVLDPSMHLVFTFGSVPVRFTRGDEAGRPTGSVLSRNGDEIDMNKQAFLGFYEEMAEKFWRVIIVKNSQQQVKRVQVSLVNEAGDRFHTWTAPLKADISELLRTIAASNVVPAPPANPPGVEFDIEKQQRRSDESAG